MLYVYYSADLGGFAGTEAEPYLADAMRLRHAIVPWLYSLAAATHRDSTPSGDVRELERARRLPRRYYFGAAIVHPITRAVDASTRTARATTWLPPGAWTRWDGGRRWAGPANVTEEFALGEVPWDGAGRARLSVAPVRGGFAGLPPSRAHRLQLRGAPRGWRPAAARCNGGVVPPAGGPAVVGWWRCAAGGGGGAEEASLASRRGSVWGVCGRGAGAIVVACPATPNAAATVVDVAPAA
eukprot:gene16618-8655_t